ncbi:MAG: methanogenesis marker 17 protein [Archaeoglobales archaeon]|nr:methanogenesis marker 17 protein [Archaeoglobales archaeon]
MRLVVESPDEEGRIAYERTINTVLSESTIKGFIKRLKVFADPKEPVFILIIQFARGGGVLKFSEVATLKFVREGAIVVCENDKFMPEVLRILWEKFGSEKVEQLSRYEIMVKGEIGEDILNTIIYDPEKELMVGLMDLILRIVPEGFRIRKYIRKEGLMALIASEDPIKNEWVEKALKMMEGADDTSNL